MCLCKQGHGFSVFLCICVTLISSYWRHLVCICVRSTCVSEGTSCLCLVELSGDREGLTVPFSTLCRTDILWKTGNSVRDISRAWPAVPADVRMMYGVSVRYRVDKIDKS